MNAAQAREITKSNAPKLIENIVQANTLLINNSIKNAAKEGKFAIKIQLLITEFTDEVVDRLVKHYQWLGYKVEVNPFFYSKMFQISWEDF